MKKLLILFISTFLVFACFAEQPSDTTKTKRELCKYFIGANIGTGSSFGKYRVSWDLNLDLDVAFPVNKKSALGVYASYRSWTTFVPGIFWTREKYSEGHANLWGIGFIMNFAHSRHYKDFDVNYNFSGGLEFKGGHSFPCGLYFLVGIGTSMWLADYNSPYYYYDANREIMNVYNTDIYMCHTSLNIHASIGYRFNNNKKE